MKSKATAWDLEEMAEVEMTAAQHTSSTPIQHRNIHQKCSDIKEKFSTCWNMKRREAALKRHVRVC